MTSAVLHPGAMGSAVAAQLVAAGHRCAWLPTGRGGLRVCEVVLSVCPPAAALDIAAILAPREPGTTRIYLSPGRGGVLPRPRAGPTRTTPTPTLDDLPAALTRPANGAAGVDHVVDPGGE
ncbi:hypothetical protein ACFPM7_22980 [Actinokineospora guangxiensis]|uniref:6-phosphogluconate dehydrogenase NADP-binding domain-containing protein n=1 Tax=Actinokineospora guangxiensis TaxID=1490288 RepID=A0ABW0EUK6_9PSEU